MLAKERRRARRLTRIGGKIQWQTRHEIAANAGLIDRGEQRVRRGAARVVAHQLAKILEVTPQHAGAGESFPDLVEGMAPAPNGARHPECTSRPAATPPA